MNHSTLFPVGKMFLVLKVSWGSFYTWLKNAPSSKKIENQMFETEILHTFENSKKIYGSPRFAEELHGKNIKVSRPRVTRMMRRANLRSKILNFYPRKTPPPKASNIIPPSPEFVVIAMPAATLIPLPGPS